MAMTDLEDVDAMPVPEASQSLSYSIPRHMDNATSLHSSERQLDAGNENRPQILPDEYDAGNAHSDAPQILSAANEATTSEQDCGNVSYRFFRGFPRLFGGALSRAPKIAPACY